MGQQGTARVVTANRAQTSFEMLDLDLWLAPDHLARVVVTFVERLNLRSFYDAIGSRQGAAGAPGLDPAVVLALWLYATLDGVGSARLLERLTTTDLAYRWIRGGMPLNHHSLSDFRVGMAADFDRLLSESVADLVAEGVVQIESVLIDGTKIAASAGKGSYKTAAGLAELERVARAHIDALKVEVDADPAVGLRRRNAARDRALRERLNHIEAARATRATIERERAERADRRDGKGGGTRSEIEPKASLTDPDARMMRFADGSTRPGYNIQVAATPVHGFILAITATTRRNDSDLAGPMVAEIERRTGRRPTRIIVDQGFASTDDIAALGKLDPPVAVYAPVPLDRVDIKPETIRRRELRRANEPQPVKEWRERMKTAGAQAAMRQRKRIELVNAHLKTQGLAARALRGLAKVQTNCLLAALAHNLATAARCIGPRRATA